VRDHSRDRRRLCRHELQLLLAVAVCYSELQCVAVSCSVLQCVTVSCSLKKKNQADDNDHLLD